MEAREPAEDSTARHRGEALRRRVRFLRPSTLRLESAALVGCALGVTVLFGVAGLLSDEAEPAASGSIERELTYDGSEGVDFGPGDGEPAGGFHPEDGRPEDAEPAEGNFGPGDGEPAGGFGPGDGEPAVNFRLRCTPSGLEQSGLEQPGIAQSDVGVLSVHLNDRYLYTIGLPRADAIAPIDGLHGLQEGFVFSITQKQAETVLGRSLVDPDLPPVTVSCVLYDGLTMGFVDVVTWVGYLQGCWLEFPELTPATEEAGDEPQQPVLKPRVDISATFGRATPIDLRLGKNTIYYMLFASQDREAALLHPEDPEVYARARVVSGGTFSWKEEDEGTGSSDRKPNLVRLKYTPRSDTTYLVLWALHRAVQPAIVGDAEESASASEAEGDTRASGWTRSAVYELTNGDEQDPNVAE